MDQERISQQSLGEIVARYPQAARLMESYGLDYCCGGKKTLRQACEDQKIDQAEVIEAFSRLEENAFLPSQIANEWPVEFLITFIVQTHHAYIRTNIPYLKNLCQQVVAAHGARHPFLKQIQHTFGRLADDLLEHLEKEENGHFPMIRQLSAENISPSPNQMERLQIMEYEHEYAGSLLADLRLLSNDYTAPNGACTKFRLLYTLLDAFEKDLHAHIHLENNILLPKVRTRTRSSFNEN